MKCVSTGCHPSFKWCHPAGDLYALYQPETLLLKDTPVADIGAEPVEVRPLWRSGALMRGVGGQRQRAPGLEEIVLCHHLLPPARGFPERSGALWEEVIQIPAPQLDLNFLRAQREQMEAV